MGIFFFMYTDENDGTMVEMWDLGDFNSRPAMWADRFYYEMKYTSSSEVFYCPSAKLPIGGNRKWPAEYTYPAVNFPGSSVPDSGQAAYVYGLRSAVFWDIVKTPIRSRT